MRTIATAATVLLLAGLAGCGGTDSKPKPNNAAPPTAAPATAMVQGRLVMVGGTAPGKGRPISGTVTFTGADGSVTKTQVDETGTFAIGLYPGTYTIAGTSPVFNDGKGRCITDPAKTKLVAGKTVTTDVACPVK